jgi:hypothetical protein
MRCATSRARRKFPASLPGGRSREAEIAMKVADWRGCCAGRRGQKTLLRCPQRAHTPLLTSRLADVNVLDLFYVTTRCITF